MIYGLAFPRQITSCNIGRPILLNLRFRIIDLEFSVNCRQRSMKLLDYRFSLFHARPHGSLCIRSASAFVILAPLKELILQPLPELRIPKIQPGRRQTLSLCCEDRSCRQRSSPSAVPRLGFRHAPSSRQELSQFPLTGLLPI